MKAAKSDLIQLEAGDLVPADARLLDCAGLKADESAVTGESLPVTKDAHATLSEDTPLGDRTNLVIASSIITAGRATAVVTATGMDTEMGKIAALLLGQKEVDTPMQRKMVEISKKLSLLCLGVCAILFGVGLLQGKPLLSMLLIAVSLAVAAIPEGLATVVTVVPAIVTIVLALGVQRLAARHAIVKKLPAVETLGCASVICSDKTGTLTRNQMTVTDLWTPTPKGKELALVIGALCSDATLNPDGSCAGDPTETAIVLAAQEQGFDKNQLEREFPRVAELPFDSTRKRMTTVHPKSGGGYRIMVKGAADVLLSRSTHILRQGVQPLDADARTQVEDANTQMANQALRVLGLAYKEVSRLPRVSDFGELEKNLTFIGLVGMIDPPRAEVKAAVQACHHAGIRPVMITGDHKITAAAIAKRIGILKDLSEACEGVEIENMSDEELRGFVPKISVYARVSPEHKIRIVRAWQERGNIVSMTGDGVNDAPALKQADIGVAMGVTGTEVAKDAAAMVLTDDNFATIVKAVENGRNLYRNIKYAIQFLLSGNFGAILAVLYASIAGLPVPFAPVHLLFINLLTDSLPAIALGVEPHTSDVMNEKPRPADESILTKDFLSKIGLEGLVIGVMTMISFLTGYHQDGALLGSTYAFGTLCLARLFHGYNCKSDHPVIFTKRFFNNKWMQGAFALGAILITAVLTIPGLHQVFKVETLNFEQLGTVYLYAFACFPIIQLLKWVRGKLSE